MNIEAKIASSEKEKESIFGLRYKIYIEEMGRGTHADHDSKIIKDLYDDLATLVYLASESDGIVGTLRINFGSDGPLELEEEYGMKKYGGIYYPDQVSTSSKLMILDKYRESTAAIKLMKFGYDLLVKNNVKFDFINANFHLLEFYEKVGYSRYQDDFFHEEYGIVTPLVMDVDKSRLARMRFR